MPGKRITVAALGSRGDVQPLLALSLGLRAAGHTVTVVAGSNFADWVAGHGLRLLPALDIEALLNTERGLAWTGSSESQFKQLRMMASLFDEHAEAMFAVLMQAAPDTDLYLSGLTSEPLVQTVSAQSGVPYLNAFLQPQLPTRSGAATMVPIVARGTSRLNVWVGHFALRLLWLVAAKPANRLRAQAGLPPHTAASYAAQQRGVPVVYGYSALVSPAPPDWPARATVTGYWFLEEDAGWPPPGTLMAFLAAGPPPVYIGFGSMSNRAPEKTLGLILEAVSQAGVRAIIGAGWGKLARGASLPPHVHVIDSAPHGWLFPRVSAVVHHGGAGTTAAALRAGRPTMIIPHMADQPFWGRRVHELGVGVRPVPRHQLTVGRLARGLRQLAGDEAMRVKAAALGEKIQAERGVDRAVDVINACLRDPPQP
jgi:UDP:flavonoid glycosyltransferase YjiC (YdhE family)